MQIRITFRIQQEKQNKEYNILVQDKQKIVDTLKIIDESLKLKIDFKRINFVRSKRNKEIISIYEMYKNSKIYSGDILEICM